MILRRIAALAAAGLALAPQFAAAAKWTVRPKESSISLVVSFEGVPVNAKFGTWNADIDFDPADLAHSKAVVHIGTGSFDSQSDERDEVVKEEDWFDVMKFPQASFVTKSISATGAGRYEATADLTIRGVSREVRLPFTLAIDGAVAHMDGNVNLQRGDFGIGQGEWKATDHVGAAVAVQVHVVADHGS